MRPAFRKLAQIKMPSNTEIVTSSQPSSKQIYCEPMLIHSINRKTSSLQFTKRIVQGKKSTRSPQSGIK